MDFGGGGNFHDPGTKTEVFSLNITQDPSGIAHYDESLSPNYAGSPTPKAKKPPKAHKPPKTPPR